MFEIPVIFFTAEAAGKIGTEILLRLIFGPRWGMFSVVVEPLFRTGARFTSSKEIADHQRGDWWKHLQTGLENFVCRGCAVLGGPIVHCHTQHEDKCKCGEDNGREMYDLLFVPLRF
ncbi:MULTISPECIES: hypothetical protein [unclassified Caballeronia]|uniref:hypothetical protein n=1 Tax=unclassified Caballeronia TaxID=2646786 RepID=UPI00158AAE66|nr:MULTISPECIES: hypothetical protein [unclassified Caballeronia]MCE4547594.1 hypothetical protein [Caballeronia sp. PC1]MCE4575052.1 hypothetical protein [Caballeronia sp. CLC5]